MKKLFGITLFFVIKITLAQFFGGYETDNFNGTHGVLLNPANIADSRVQVDINLFGFGAMVANDYVDFAFSKIPELIDEGEFFDNIETNATNRNNALVNFDILGPSFMFNLNEKHSVGLYTRIRSFNNYNNINGNLAEGILNGFGNEDFNLEMNNLDGTSHVWGEIGLTYGRVLFYDYDKHYLKAGITIKGLVGMGFAQGSSTNLTGTYTVSNQSLTLNGDLSYATTFKEDQSTSDYLDNIAIGQGVDIGVIYELRTRSSRLADVDDNPRAINKYKLKVGLSLLDFGQIKYNDTIKAYTLNESFNPNDEGSIEDLLDQNFTPQNIPAEITMALPTSINLNLDYKIMPLVYANLNVNQTVVKSSVRFNNNRLNQISLTPRFETRIFSLYLPLAYSQLGGTTLGVGFKAGPLILSSQTLISNLFMDVPSVNLFFGTKIPINHRK